MRVFHHMGRQISNTTTGYVNERSFLLSIIFRYARLLKKWGWYMKIYPPGHKKRKSLFLWFLYDRTSFRSHTYTTDRPCVTLSAGKISAIYIKHWLRKRKINLTHSHVVATNTCNYAYMVLIFLVWFWLGKYSLVIF